MRRRRSRDRSVFLRVLRAFAVYLNEIYREAAVFNFKLFEDGILDSM